jgi:hypothetical protein
MVEFRLTIPPIKDGKCEGCGQDVEQSRHLKVCSYWKEAEKILKESRKREQCPEACGRFTICESCAELSPQRCQRCEMLFREEERWEKSNSENFDYRCPHCSQPHLRKVSEEDVAYLVPVDPKGNSIECKKFPETSEKDICECCGKEIHILNNHRTDCVFWKAYSESNEMEKTENDQEDGTPS